MPADNLASSETAWISRQVRAMAVAWSRGERMLAEDVLARFPGLGDEETVRLIYEEVSLRREAGENVATTEVVARYPRYKDELEVLLGCDRMLRPFSRVATFPSAPCELGPFRLLAELGRGASGTTYLAAEPALGDRLVALKVVAETEQEHLRLARLQHTHIIPLFSEHTFPDRGLRALCMPYLRGTSLARLLESVTKMPRSARQGRHLVAALDAAQAKLTPFERTLDHELANAECDRDGARVESQQADPTETHARQSGCMTKTPDGPYRRYLAQATYVEAVCWIVACLADGLESAHAHGLVHLDIKPSNVLIAGDGLPMLLDFHLARKPLARGERIADRLGGTPGWMAAEHRAAMEAVSRGEAVSEPVDERADIFALGLLLREALAGPTASPVAGCHARAERSWSSKNPEISVGLADIIEKCLAARPGDRYRSAKAVANDLRRHLSDQPLEGVANRSAVEASRKWRRRRPDALSHWAARLAMGATLATVIGVASMLYRNHVQQIAAELELGTRLRCEGRLTEAARVLLQARQRAGLTPTTGSLQSSIDNPLGLVRRAQRAAALHELAERVRFRYGVDSPTPDEARAMTGKIGAVWSRRRLVLDQSDGMLDPNALATIKSDLLDLAVAWADLQAGANQVSDGLRILDEAEGSCGPSPQIDLERQLLGCRPDAADRTRPSSAMGHYFMGCSDLRANQFVEAALEFEQVVAERP